MSAVVALSPVSLSAAGEQRLVLGGLVKAGIGLLLQAESDQAHTARNQHLSRANS